MYAALECYSCLENLALKTADLSTNDPDLKQDATEKAIEYLAGAFPQKRIPAFIATVMQRIIRQKTNCHDPFDLIKKQEMETARILVENSRLPAGNDIREYVEFAAKGNNIDYFINTNSLEKEINGPVDFVIDHISWLEEALNHLEQTKDTPKIMYLADNAGECYFDAPLVGYLKRFTEVFYAVKDCPVQNDLTMKEVNLSGIKEKLGTVITTGTDSPGLDLSAASPEFLDVYNSVDLFIAKGMGYYETLGEVMLPAPAFLILKAKCYPVANALGVPFRSYVGYRLKQQTVTRNRDILTP